MTGNVHGFVRHEEEKLPLFKMCFKASDAVTIHPVNQKYNCRNRGVTLWKNKQKRYMN